LVNCLVLTRGSPMYMIGTPALPMHPFLIQCRYKARLPSNATCIWSLFVVSADGVPVSGEDLAPALLGDTASSGSLQAYLPGGSLLPSTQYSVQVTVQLGWPGGVVTDHAELRIATAGCPLGGFVTSSLTTGVAGVTR
jgi:hypothetical protein